MDPQCELRGAASSSLGKNQGADAKRGCGAQPQQHLGGDVDRLGMVLLFQSERRGRPEAPVAGRGTLKL